MRAIYGQKGLFISQDPTVEKGEDHFQVKDCYIQSDSSFNDELGP